AQLQAYALKPTAAPTAFLNEKLSAGKLPALKPEKGGLFARGPGRDATDAVRAFVDPKNGDASFTPSLADLVRAPARQALPADRPGAAARPASAAERFTPKDGTGARLAEPIGLIGGATAHVATTPGRVEARQLMTMVPAVRYVGGLKVY